MAILNANNMALNAAKLDNGFECQHEYMVLNA